LSISGWLLAIGGWLLAIGVGIGFVMEASSSVVAWEDGEFMGGASDGAEWNGKIDEGVASLSDLWISDAKRVYRY
jgi:hypothetical protein